MSSGNSPVIGYVCCTRSSSTRARLHRESSLFAGLPGLTTVAFGGFESSFGAMFANFRPPEKEAAMAETLLGPGVGFSWSRQVPFPLSFMWVNSVEEAG